MSKSTNLPKIPEDWKWVPISEIVEVSGGGTPSTNVPEYWNGEIPWLTPTDVTSCDSSRISKGSRNISKLGLQKSSARLIPAQSVLMTSRATIGEVVINEVPMATNQGFINIQLNSSVLNNKYLAFWISSVKNYLISIATGTTFKELSKTKFKTIKFPLAPIETQIAIVSKLEELFSQLDAGLASLERTKLLLTHYRQAVLKAAMTGELTKEWRENHLHELEPASVLLERILLERRQKWEEEQLAKFQEQGKIPKDEKWKEKYKEPLLEQIGDFDIPNVWTWATINMLSLKINPGFASGKHHKDHSATPHLRPMNINSKGEIDLSVVKYVNKDNFDSLNEGDVLFNNTNSPKLLGKTAPIKKDTDWAYSNHMTRIRISKDLLNNSWIAFNLHYLFYLGFYQLNCKHHVNQASITKEFLGNKITIPLPSLKEQNIIVEECEKYFSLIDYNERMLEDMVIGINKLKQSILKSAFEGKLISESPLIEINEKIKQHTEEENEKIKRTKQITLDGWKKNE